MKRYKIFSALLVAVILLCTLISGCIALKTPAPSISLDNIPEFTGKPYVTINSNKPFFTDDEITNKSFEDYSKLDILGRCGVASSCIGIDIMPTEERGSIGQVKPSGWQSVRYDFVDGKYLYNRCHLIGFQLAGENANERNLITGTRYMNVIGMLPFENIVADYVKETENHVMYRVTPIFRNGELVARGVLMEAWSVEDNGDGVCFNVYVYNNQPNVTIDYADGTSRESANPYTTPKSEVSYVLNNKTKKFHKPNCSSVDTIRPENRQDYTGTRADLLAQGYTGCKSCGA